MGAAPADPRIWDLLPVETPFQYSCIRHCVILNNIGLNQLLFDNNKIGNGLLHIAKALQQLNSLEVLNLGNTNMPKEVCTELTFVIECNQNLSTIKLDNNDLRSSANSILQALSKNSLLKVLDLQANNVNEEAGKLISSVIITNTGLNQLLLNKNYLGKSVLHIVKALQQNTCLLVLG